MSFWELLVIGIVALLVLGPEKLPGAIRTVTGTIRSIRQFGNQMKSELADELRVHELHEKLRQAEEKGLLGLSAEEIQALSQLRNAAAEVNDPYNPQAASSPTAISPSLAATNAPGAAVQTATQPSASVTVSPQIAQTTTVTATANSHEQPTNTEHHEQSKPPRP